MSTPNEGNETTTGATVVAIETGTTANNSNNNTTEDVTGNNQENGRRCTHNNNRKPQASATVFKGEMTKMNGHVFQVHSERKYKSQFMETVEALRVYASTACKSDIESMAVLFTKLEMPSVEEHDDPIEDTKLVDGKVVTAVSKFEEMKYAENMKQWIRDDKSLKSTIRSLYHIVMGQCFKIMKNKLLMAKDFARFEKKET